LAAIR
jgi:hypothetical protein